MAVPDAAQAREPALPAGSARLPPFLRRDFWRLDLVSEEMLHLDLLRFVAAFGIVISHSFELMLPRELRAASHPHTRDLALFVEVFFIVSGYVIARVYADRMGSVAEYARFVQRRLGRLLPLHLVTLVAAALLVAAIGAIGMQMNTQPSLSARCLGSAALMIHAWIPCGGWPPNGASWSISAEMAVYLAFPLLLWISRYRIAATVVVFPATLYLAQHVLGGLAAWPDDPLAIRALPTFFLGVLLYRWRDVLARIPMSGALSAVAIAALIAGSFLLWPTPLNLALGALGACLAVAADCRGQAPAFVRRYAPLGQLTYSIYMIHGILLLVVANGLGDKVLRLPLPAMIVLTLATYALIFVASILSLRLLENPARRWFDRLPFPGTGRR